MPDDGAPGRKLEQRLEHDNRTPLPKKTINSPSETSNSSLDSPNPDPPPFNPKENPDGGLQAWLCVLGAWCCLFSSFGWVNVIGVFQSYYQTHQLSAYTPSAISWILSLELFLQFGLGPVVGAVLDSYGHRWVLATGTVLHVLGLMMISLCTEYWQFVLAQGVLSPLGVCMVFYPALTTLNTWFFKRRAFAFGISTTGASIGGVVLPIMVQRLISEIGFGWAIRATAFLIFALLLLANATLTSRMTPSKKKVVVMESVRPLAELPYALLVTGCFFVFLGLFIPINYIITEAEYHGVHENIAQYLVSILNAASLFGRIIPAYFADMIGRFNMLIAMCFLNAILILAMWLPATSTAPIIAFAALYGFSSGAFISNSPPCVAQISPDMSKIGVRNGTFFAFIAVAGLISNPIGGRLISLWNGAYTGLQIFAGVMCAWGSCMIVMARIRSAGWKWSTKF